MKRLSLFLILSVLVAAFPFPAQGQQRCAAPGEHDLVIERFQQSYGEHLRARGVSMSGFLLEIIVNDETGSWTVFMTRVTGGTCLMSFGQGWEEFAPKPPGSDS